MSDKLQRRDEGQVVTWQFNGARLDRTTFAQGLALVAAAERRDLTDEATTAYYLALAGVETEDFAMGLQIALRRERFMTPAALFEACEEAEGMRQAKRRRQEELAEMARLSEEREARRRGAEARTAALRAEADGWKAPPADVAELRARIVLLLELRGGQSSALYLARRAEVSGTVENMVMTVEHGAFFRRAAGPLSDVATEAAGYPVRVTVRPADTAAPRATITSEEWEKRREELKRQAEDIAGGAGTASDPRVNGSDRGAA